MSRLKSMIRVMRNLEGYIHVLKNCTDDNTYIMAGQSMLYMVVFHLLLLRIERIFEKILYLN